MLILGIITGLIILVILVVAHEFGHAWVAHRNGVVVEEFGIGLPPRAKGWKLKNGFMLSLNWLPLGGFVKLQGETDDAKKKGDYGRATFWQKTKILFAGVMMNWVVAAILLTILAVTGLPKILPNQFQMPGDTKTVLQPVQVAGVESGYPAAKAGLKTGDKIISVNGRLIRTTADLINDTKSERGKIVAIEYQRGSESKIINVKLRDSSSAVLGVELGQEALTRSTWSAPIVGVVTTLQFSWVTLVGVLQVVWNLLTGLVLLIVPAAHHTSSADLSYVSGSVAGPVGIVGEIFPAAAKAGPTQLTLLSAIISLTLAVMNILPIPALDGGRWFVSALFRLRKKVLTKEKEERITFVGFSVLMLLIVVITVGDVAKLF